MELNHVVRLAEFIWRRRIKWQSLTSGADDREDVRIMQRLKNSYNMNMRLMVIKTRKIFLSTTKSGVHSTSFRIIGALIAIGLLLWTVHYGYQATTGQRRHPLHCQWISRVGALIMLSGILLLALGIPIIADLFLRLSEELHCPEDTDIQHSSSSSKLKVKIDVPI
ncbi:hypothetical protein RJT34_08189 [Clitoria ternatea]|uniref:Uncharacterized protein n=1 Tax=Clitoria ternatea TaxID=43366 RepID=A0AAN9PUQ0_CLITE